MMAELAWLAAAKMKPLCSTAPFHDVHAAAVAFALAGLTREGKLLSSSTPEELASARQAGIWSMPGASVKLRSSS